MTSLEQNVNRLQNFKNKGKDQEVSFYVLRINLVEKPHPQKISFNFYKYIHMYINILINFP